MSSFSPYIFVHLLLFITFAISGLITNLLQLITYVICVILCKNRKLFRKINFYFTYVIYGQIEFLSDWWTRGRIRLFVDPDKIQNVGKSHALIVMNHHYELDWLFGWMVADR